MNTNYPSFTDILNKFQNIITKLFLSLDFSNIKQSNPQNLQSGITDPVNQNDSTAPFSVKTVQTNNY